MKKKICTMLILLLSMLLAFSLTGCFDNGEPAQPNVPASSSSQQEEPPKPYMPENAQELWNKVDAVMDSVTSVEVNGEFKAVYYYTGYEFKMDSTYFEISTGDVHYTENESTVICDELSVNQTARAISAYYDGKMYVSNNDGYSNQMLCAPITKEAYLETRKEGLTDEVDMSECTKAEFSKNEDDTWSLEFSGYTKKTVDKVLDSIGLGSDMLGAAIEDMKVTVLADARFYVQTMSLELVFAEEEGSPLPEFLQTMEYSNYDSATFDPSGLAAENYKEVVDVYILDEITDGFKERQNAASGSFVLDLKTTTRYYSQTHTAKETDTVIYGKKNGAYYYSIDAVAEGTKVTLAYQNGTSTVTSGGESYSEYVSEKDAKAMVDSLIDSARYSNIAVTDIEKKSDGVYVLTCDKIDTSTYEATLQSLGVKLSSGKQTITVTFKDGKLMKVESTVYLKGKIEYDPIELDMHSVVTFDQTTSL